MSKQTYSAACLTAIALLEEVQKYRKDDAQGITVSYATKDENITLTVTQKPGSGGRYGGGGGGGEQEHTVAEIEAIIKKHNIAEMDYNIKVVGDKIKIKAPFNEALGKDLNEAGCIWNKDEKVRICKLKGGTAPSP